MRIQRSFYFFLSTTLMLFCWLPLASCGTQQNRLPGTPPQAQPTRTPQQIQSTGISQSSQGISDHAVSPIVLHDAAPGELEVLFNVNMPQNGADNGNVIIGLSFLSHGNPVQLLGDVQLLCNGQAMSVHQPYAFFQLANDAPQSLQGKSIACTYHVANSTTSFSLIVPRMPAIRSPQNGTSVSRSTHTVVNYQYDPQSGQLSGLVALGSGAKTLTNQMDTPDIGQATLDTSAFPSGDGSLTLTQALTPHVIWAGTQFRSLQAEGMATAQIRVTWI
ncbi:hypothetical protein [Tengunoibacter tsumagoiensis]|uniref:Uncharacterized protein n=1 Tax=Tengunoibacter tsumagoiensis TaxID=2014871 RepID=A0A402A3B0_9CHLR|nr:hypothetical protein [Tengunoibacter tsumagoiensis]GCE13526.1 hypothetical protein KTT_33850 [Tengunoibacter tsumagoiensis]